jgi:hypothetical protein
MRTCGECSPLCVRALPLPGTQTIQAGGRLRLVDRPKVSGGGELSGGGGSVPKLGAVRQSVDDGRAHHRTDEPQGGGRQVALVSHPGHPTVFERPPCGYDTELRTCSHTSSRGRRCTSRVSSWVRALSSCSSATANSPVDASSRTAANVSGVAAPAPLSRSCAHAQG